MVSGVTAAQTMVMRATTRIVIVMAKRRQFIVVAAAEVVSAYVAGSMVSASWPGVLVSHELTCEWKRQNGRIQGLGNRMGRRDKQG